MINFFMLLTNESEKYVWADKSTILVITKIYSWKYSRIEKYFQSINITFEINSMMVSEMQHIHYLICT